ncbi:STAS domain-containing protein [Actinomadura adrarensis]|uniref:Anti-sigma factor antagonist n=1 Tax=Actinomadura adrarensis TaxID=1819600 RepID=A0ABW3CL80_9ACTN
MENGTATPTTPSGAAALDISVEASGPWLTVRLRGELDLNTAPTLNEQVDDLVARRSPPRIALEMSEVTFCDSSGLNTLVRLWRRTTAKDGRLVLLRPPDLVVRTLEITGLDRYLPMSDTLPDDAP